MIKVNYYMTVSWHYAPDKNGPLLSEKILIFLNPYSFSNNLKASL